MVKRQITRFIITGVCAVTVDLLSYYLLINYLNNDLSKGLSFILGTIFAFNANKYWTFEKYKKSLSEIIHFSVLYSSTLIINVLINRIILDLTDILFFAFLIATFSSATINFIGQKFWVFKKKELS